MHFKIYIKKNPTQYSCYRHVTSTHSVHNSVYKSSPNSVFTLGRMLAKRHVMFSNKVVVYSLNLYDLNMCWEVALVTFQSRTFHFSSRMVSYFFST